MCFKRPKQARISSLKELEKNQEQFKLSFKTTLSLKTKLSKKEVIQNNKELLELNTINKERDLYLFMKEYVTCNNCHNTYSLRDNKIGLCCNGCDKFYCCGIAGNCKGADCKVMINKILCRARYCINCSSKIIKLGEVCLCKTCK